MPPALVQAGKKGMLSSVARESGESPLRQRDRVLSTIKAYGLLKPDQRKSLLTEKVGPQVTWSDSAFWCSAAALSGPAGAGSSLGVDLAPHDRPARGESPADLPGCMGLSGLSCATCAAQSLKEAHPRAQQQINACQKGCLNGTDAIVVQGALERLKKLNIQRRHTAGGEQVAAGEGATASTATAPVAPGRTEGTGQLQQSVQEAGQAACSGVEQAARSSCPEGGHLLAAIL